MRCGSALFETAIGTCALAWSPEGVLRVLLPEREVDALRARLRKLAPDATETEERPPAIQALIAAIRMGLSERQPIISVVTLDLGACSPFQRSVYAATASIPFGETRCYGEIAGAVGDKRLAREVGQALGRNPVPLLVPCHRVLGRDGRAGGFSAPGGLTTKMRLLELERAGARGATGSALFPDLPLAIAPRQR